MSDWHGTTTGYYGNKCRCADCREAARLYYHAKVKTAPPRPCDIEGCPRMVGRRLRLCDSHAKARREGKPLDYTPRATGDDVGYDAAHKRLMRARGPARTNQCAHCERPAIHWAFIHGSPGERPPGVKGNGRLHGAWSLNADEYMPLCASCHKIYDNAHKAVRGGC